MTQFSSGGEDIAIARMVSASRPRAWRASGLLPAWSIGVYDPRARSMGTPLQRVTTTPGLKVGCVKPASIFETRYVRIPPSKNSSRRNGRNAVFVAYGLGRM